MYPDKWHVVDQQQVLQGSSCCTIFLCSATSREGNPFRHWSPCGYIVAHNSLHPSFKRINLLPLLVTPRTGVLSSMAPQLRKLPSTRTDWENWESIDNWFVRPIFPRELLFCWRRALISTDFALSPALPIQVDSSGTQKISERTNERINGRTSARLQH